MSNISKPLLNRMYYQFYQVVAIVGLGMASNYVFVCGKFVLFGHV